MRKPTNAPRWRESCSSVACGEVALACTHTSIAEGEGSVHDHPDVPLQRCSLALEFLERAFGFERHAVYEGAGGEVAHAEMKAAGGWLMLGSSRPDSPYDIGRQSVYVVIEGDVDAHCERARQ